MSEIIYSELELLSLNNQIEKIKQLDLNDIDENECNKMFTRACEKGNIEIIKYIYKFCSNEIFNHGIYACLYFTHIESATYIFNNIINNVNEFEKYIFYSYQVFFHLDNFEAINFLLNNLPDYTISCCSFCDGLSGCPFLIGIKQNSYKSVKIFLDFVIKYKDYNCLNEILNKFENHCFYTACENNYLEITKYLCEINKNYHIEFDDENKLITNYYIETNNNYF